jgi:CHASE3 domain sensor protein
MSWALSKRATLAVTLLLVFLITNMIFSIQSIKRMVQSQQRVTHTHEVMVNLEDLLSSMKDAETGQRGFLITGDESYLEPYHRALARIHSIESKLNQLVRGDAQQSALAAELAAPIDGKLKELEMTIALRKSDGFDAARKVVDSDAGKKYMDQIRQDVAQMETTENAERGKRISEMEESSRNAILTFSISTTISLVLLVMTIMTFQHDLLNRKRASDKLDEQHEQLAVTLSSIGDGVIVTDTEGNITT